MTIYIILGIILLLAIYILVMYNKLVKINNIVKEAFSTMDIYLKKRWDLIPNLVEVVKEYEKHEKETFSQIANLRTNQYNSMPMNRKIKVNEQLTPEVSKVIVISERYP